MTVKEFLSSPIGKSLLYWLFVNLVLVHSQIYWNWNATDGTDGVIDGSKKDGRRFNFTEEELDELLQVVPLERLELLEISEEPLPYEVALIEDNRDQLRQELEKAEEAMKQAQEDISWLNDQVENLEQSIEELDVELAKISNDANGIDTTTEVKSEIEKMQLNMPKLEPGNRRPETATLLSRLMYDARYLSDIKSTEELIERFEPVIQGIDKEVSHANEVNWSFLTSSCRLHLPLQVVDNDLQNPTSVCPMTPDNEMEVHGEDLPSNSDISGLIADAEKRWNAYYDEVEVPLLLPGSLERVESKRDALVEKWKEKVEMKANQRIQAIVTEIKQMGEEMDASLRTISEESRETDVPAGSCIEMDQAEAIIEAAIRALERKQDLRRAILNAMSLKGIDTSKVILDAILGDGKEGLTIASQSLSKSKDEVTLTWRQVLDTPFAKSITQSWVPFVVDVVGGYNDQLDEWLDRSIPVEDLVSGKTLTSLLELAGEKQLSPVVADWFLAQRRKEMA